MSRRPSVSIYNYPEALNPFNDDTTTTTTSTTSHVNGELKNPVKEPKHKFWTFGRSKKKQRSNSFSIKSTWSGLFGKRKEAQEVEIRKPAIATVSSTYKRGTYNGYPATPARSSTDQQEFDEALGTLARRRKYTLDNSSRYSSSLTVNGDPGRIYEGTPQDTTASIMGDLTPKPPARRFGQMSPKPTNKLPPLDFGGKERTSNGNVVLEESEPNGTPVAPKRGGRRASQRSIVPPRFDDDDSSRSGDVTLRDENENVPDDYIFKRFSRDAIRQSNLSINSCVSVGSTVSAYGRKKRRAPQPPRLKEPLESPKEIDVKTPEAVEKTEELHITESIDIARVTENIDEMTKRSRELVDNSPPTSPTTKEGDKPKEEETLEVPSILSSSHENSNEPAVEIVRKISKPRRVSREETKNVSKNNSHDVDSPISSEETSQPGISQDSSTSSHQIETEVQVELRRKSGDEKIEIIKDIRSSEENIPLARHESSGNLSRSDSFCVKEVIDNIERKIKYLEAKNARDGSKEEINEIFERCSARKSLRENRKHFFRNMTDENGVKVEIKELPREQNDIKIVRLEDPPVAVEGPTDPVKVIELHISEPIRQKPAIFSDREINSVNPIPKPRRHSNLSLECKETRTLERRDDEDNEKRGNSL